MFLREYGSHQFECNTRPFLSALGFILSRHINRMQDGRRAHVDLSRKYELVRPLRGILISTSVLRRRRLGRYRESPPNIRTTRTRASCNTHVQGERYLPTYLSTPGQFASQMELAAVPESSGFVCRTLNVTVLWTWDDSDI